MPEMQNVNAGAKNIHSTVLLLAYADLDSVLTQRHFLDIHLYFTRTSHQHSTPVPMHMESSSSSSFGGLSEMLSPVLAH